MMIHGYRNGDQVEGAEITHEDQILIDMMAAASYFIGVEGEQLDFVTCEDHSGHVGVWACRYDGWTVRLGCNRYLHDIFPIVEKLRVAAEFGVSVAP